MCVCVFFFFWGGGGGGLGRRIYVSEFSNFFFVFKNAALGKKCVCAFDETVNVLVQCFALDMWVL